MLAGCAGTPEPVDYSQDLAAIGKHLDRMREIVHTDKPTPAALNEISSIRRKLRDFRDPLVVRGLSEALRPAADKANAVFIRMMDDRSGNSFVPVAHRARVLTIKAAVQVAAVRGVQVNQVDAVLQDIRQRCSHEAGALVPAWLSLLEAEPISAAAPGGRADITARVQGLAMLGVIRTAGTFDLSSALKRIQSGTVTAPPVLFSQWLIHLGGTRMKSSLASWLNGPADAQTAASVAVDLLRFDVVAKSPTPQRIKSARAWVAKLPDTGTWTQVVVAEMRKLAKLAKTDKVARTRREMARKRLGAPANDAPLRWLVKLPPSDRKTALERLVGLPLLINPPDAP
jgi:hypothetical protein